MAKAKLPKYGDCKPDDDDVEPQAIDTLTNHGLNAGRREYSRRTELRKQAFQYCLGLSVRPEVYHFALSSDKEHL